MNFFKVIDAAEDRLRRRRRIVATTTVALVVCIVVRVVVLHSDSQVLVLESSGMSRFLVEACNGDPQFCASTIAGLPSITIDPLDAAVKAALTLVTKTFATAEGLVGMAAPGLEQNALQDCNELLDDTVDHLIKTLSFLPGLLNILNFPAADVETFLSAGLTNQDTCIEGIAPTNGVVKSQLHNSVQQISELISNSLALAKTIANLAGVNNDFGSPFHHRRLLSDDLDFPAWLSATDRRLLQAPAPQANAVVAQDGTGDYTTIAEAVNAAPDISKQRYVIYVKAGVYYENVEISKKKTNLTFIGDGMESTVVSGNKSVGGNTTTYRSATFAVKGAGFIARHMGFENTAGAQNHQAVALRVGADQSVFYRCGFKGYQDTLYVHSFRQFFRECQIYGTVDFMFGNAAAMFQSCTIMARRPLENQTITVTAQGRSDPNQNTGISIHDSNITAAPDFVPVKASVPTYLGRPWKQYSRAVLMQSYLDDIVDPKGWAQWNASNFGLDTLYYGEYMNYGPGAGLAERINWLGYHFLSTEEANTFTVAQFIDGNKWLPATGITYLAGLKE